MQEPDHNSHKLLPIIRSLARLTCYRVLTFTLTVNCCITVFAQDPKVDFFEKQIRPVLLEHCVSCHGPDEQESGLRLDSRTTILAGGDRGPAVQLDHSDQSLLLKAIEYGNDLKMPPEDKLGKDEINALRQWVRDGLTWPSGKTSLKLSMEQRIAEARTTHWSFQPIRKPPIPEVKTPAKVANPIDSFVLAKLDEAGIQPSQRADDYTLVRRLFFDVTGLPPSVKDITEFQTSTASTKTSSLIDNLLARPQYGERWARHWLDVARYADTQGYAFAKDRRYPHAYTYRDYVINAMNDDLPYDQFVLQQLAADQMELGDDSSPLAALGFLTVGRKFINHHDTLDDQIDVVTRGLMGLTVSCARCHDHKYDAISAADYYSLYGIFVNCEEPAIKPPFGKRSNVLQMNAFDEQLHAHQSRLDQFQNKLLDQQKQITTDRLGEYFYAAVSTQRESQPEKSDRASSVETGGLHPRMIERWRTKITEYSKLDSFKPWMELQSLPDDQFVSLALEKVQNWQATSQSRIGSPSPSPASVQLFSIDLILRLEQAQIKSKSDVANVYANIVRETWNEFEKLGGNDTAILKIDPLLRPFVKLFRNEDSPLKIPPSQLQDYLNESDLTRYRELQNQVRDYQAKSPPPLPRAMTLIDKKQLVESNVFLRGNHNSLGDKVPRQFVAVLSDEVRVPFDANSSGRLQLAREIVAAKNPLTARVIANRIWMHHFGQSLVDTPSDFGARCEKPVHNELLNYLAFYLQQNDWSIKSLHRLILNSNTWQQASRNRADVVGKDSENRLYWRANRRRLEWESLRDALLSVSGKLDLTMGGPAIDMFRDNHSNRRSIYGTIDRQDLPNLLRSFDFPNPDQSAAARVKTIVPQQALFLMNGPMAVDLSNSIYGQAEFQNLPDDVKRIDWLYQRIFARPAHEKELEINLRFLNQSGQNQKRESRWQSLIQALLMTNEFCFID